MNTLFIALLPSVPTFAFSNVPTPNTSPFKNKKLVHRSWNQVMTHGSKHPAKSKENKIKKKATEKNKIKDVVVGGVQLGRGGKKCSYEQICRTRA